MTLARISLLAAASLAISAELAAAAPALATRNVNIRSGPGTTFDIVATVPGGSTVDAANCKDGWCSVHWGQRAGFAIRTALDFGDGPGKRPGAPPGAVAGAPPGVVYAAPPGVVYGPPAVVYGPGYYWGPYWGPRWRRWWY